MATRLLRRYWLVLFVAFVVPVLAVGAYVLRQPATYTAHARVVAADSTPRSAAEASGVVSQVQAIATSRDLVVGVLADSREHRDPDKVIEAVTVAGLGSSTLVDVSYQDSSPEAAQRIATGIANATVTKLDAVRIGGLPDALRDIDNQLTDLASKRAPLAAAAQNNPKDLIAANRLAGIDRLISDLSGDRNRLAETAAAAGHSSVVSTPIRPQRADPRGLPAKLTVAAILGLVLGLIAVGVHEMLRPSVSTVAHVARLLEVPMLGTIAPDPVVLADIGRRIRLAAQRAQVGTVVLSRATGAVVPPELVDRVEAATLRPDAVSSRVAIPIDVDGRPALGLATVGEQNAADRREAGAVAVRLATADAAPARKVRLRRVSALEELDPTAEADRIGLVVLAGNSTRLSAVSNVRDLMAASGWPLLGVLGHTGGGAR